MYVSKTIDGTKTAKRLTELCDRYTQRDVATACNIGICTVNRLISSYKADRPTRVTKPTRDKVAAVTNKYMRDNFIKKTNKREREYARLERKINKKVQELQVLREQQRDLGLTDDAS